MANPSEMTPDSLSNAAPRLVYLDTNVYSAIADALNMLEVGVLPDALKNLGVAVGVSPVNLWEIVATENGPRREDLVWVAQHISPVGLLVEVEEIIAAHAAEVVGDDRVAHLWPRSNWSASHLAREWELTRHEKARTISLTEGAPWLKAMKESQRLLHAVASRGLGDLAFARAVGRAMAKAKRSPEPDAYAKALRKESKAITSKRPPRYADRYEEVAAMVASKVFIGLTPYPDPIDEFWSCLGVDSALDKAVFISEKLTPMFWDGPLMALAAVTEEQSRARYKPGNWFDAYHLQYLQVLPEMLTLDHPLIDLCHRQPEGSRLVTNVHDARPFVEAVVREVRALS